MLYCLSDENDIFVFSVKLIDLIFVYTTYIRGIEWFW